MEKISYHVKIFKKIPLEMAHPKANLHCKSHQSEDFNVN